MKTKIAIFSSLLCMYGMAAGASECIGAGCDITNVKKPDVQPAAETVYVEYAQPQMHQVKLLSVKPVPADGRAPLYDGTVGTYKQRLADKTVDWRDGVPIWDDSISSYKDKDFSDWFLEPMDELYLRDAAYSEQPVRQPTLMEMYNQNMADAAETRARIEDLLAPKCPTENFWTNDVTHVEITETMTATPIMAPVAKTCDKTVVAPAQIPAKKCADSVAPVAIADVTPVIAETTCNMPAPRAEYTAQDLTAVVEKTFGTVAVDDACPFETETECNIWRRKPTIRETVSPRSPKIRESKMAGFIVAANKDPNITANAAVAEPLLARYKMLMQSANACCSDGMVYSLKHAGASDGLVYKFMADDANFYGFGSRCLMMTDAELDKNYPNMATAMVAADVRNGCLCRGRQWFEAMLAPFKEAYAAVPQFADAKFYYTYTDGLQREITVSINNDVQNVLNQLSVCP